MLLGLYCIRVPYYSFGFFCPPALAAAVPQTERVMNSRRCSGRDVRFIARPPHRTVRAAFPHTAPTSGV